MKYWLVMALMLGSALAQSPITLQNWINHPRIVEVRQIYNQVAELRQQGKLRQQRKDFGYCPALDLERQLFSDAKNMVRLYISKGGGEDSAYTFEHTYDAQGRLRFVLVKAGAVNGSALELRFYLDTQGRILWQDTRATGVGYTWITDAPSHFAINPSTAFNAPNPCP